MITTLEDHDAGVLTSWVRRQSAGPKRRAHGSRANQLRFAFYGRMSTKEYQDRVTSYGWQREVADELVADQGSVVASFFDVGYSRRRGWVNRPEAGALLATLADPDRGLLRRPTPATATAVCPLRRTAVAARNWRSYRSDPPPSDHHTAGRPVPTRSAPRPAPGTVRDAGPGPGPGPHVPAMTFVGFCVAAPHPGAGPVQPQPRPGPVRRSPRAGPETAYSAARDPTGRGGRGNADGTRHNTTDQNVVRIPSGAHL